MRGGLLAVVIGLAAAKPYNVLYFLSDDLRPEVAAGFGQKQMLTPNLDKLVSESLTFENAYCQQAVCGPTRASFMSGRRPHHTNIFGNSKNFRDIGRDVNGHGSKWVTMPEHFKLNNWTTLGGGKTFHPNHPKNWDEPTSWSQVENMEYYPFSYYKPNPAYSGPCPGAGGPNGKGASKIDTWCALDEPYDNFYDQGLANNTIERLRYGAKHQPFFIQSGFARPHAPWRVPKAFWDLYKTEDIAPPKNKLPPTNMPGIAWVDNSFYNASNGYVFEHVIDKAMDDYVISNMRHAYYAAVSWLDYQIGRVLDELDALGLKDNTIVLLHGDHGWQLGEGNRWHKFTNFELGTRVPLIIRAPGKASSIGQRAHGFAELVDVYPTLAELAGTAAPTDHLDGVSLAPFFDDPTRLTFPTSYEQGTRNKSLAFSQFPHKSDWGCKFFRDDKCYNSPSGDVSYDVGKNTSSDYMGFSVRDHEYRYTVWLPWDGEEFADWDVKGLKLEELYAYAGNDGSDFDGMDTVNLAYDSAHVATAKAMFGLAREFFHDIAPPLPPSPGPSPGPSPSGQCTQAGGVSAKDGIACCPKSCGLCGGSGCGSAPGGKENCCKGTVEGNGKDCKTQAAPCSVKDLQLVV